MQLPDPIDQILAQHSDARISVEEFRDKPCPPSGETDDFCYRLGEGSLSFNISRFEEAHTALFAIGGGDIPEAHLQTRIDVSLNTNVDWRSLDEPSEQGERDVRLIIMSTDTSQGRERADIHAANLTLDVSDTANTWSWLIKNHVDYPTEFLHIIHGRLF
eukprot:Blabericola_migrator_1__9378@NODE_505_length_7965_cov_11_786781_g387_i0_p3_GENE_NODE_505_length_7965_cov_11_786781_g387_i0NODE_505_length_7965_cov_11_786781_g387_i0_p3_ORF_typecomplete_len160_score27_94Integrin_beta/PF00362_18/0_00019_NODE_505_length_7965_cov_11_786781_g387_i024062885